MERFLEYCKQNYKKIANVIIIAIVLIYILLNRCLELFNLESLNLNNVIIQVILVLASIVITIKTRKLSISRDKVKEVIKKCREIFNNFILVKVIVILLIVKILEKLLELIIN